MIDIFSEDDTQVPPSRKKGQKQATRKPSEFEVTKRRLDSLHQALTASGSQDLIAECGSNRIVLTADESYLVDHTMNDVIDGTFRILGKVTRVVSADAPAGISLLRKTAIGSLNEIPEQLAVAFESFRDAGIVGPKVETEIRGPTLQIIPVAIFA